MSRGSFKLMRKLEEKDGKCETDIVTTKQAIDACVEFCEHEFKTFGKLKRAGKSPSAAQQENFVAWKKKFCIDHAPNLLYLTFCADSLGIENLVDSAMLAIGQIAATQSVEKMRALFNIRSDFTPEEEAHIARENAWIEER